MSVFVTDGFWRKSVAVVRGLGRAGIPVHVGESTRWAPACWSRYAVGTCVYPSPRTAPDAFAERLGAECRDRAVRVCIVPEEETLAVLLDRPGTLPPEARLVAADPAAFSRARDKARTLAAAQVLGIATPWSRAPDTDAERAAAIATVPCPAVVKPRVGSGARGLRYVAERADLPAALAAVERSHGPALVQERLAPGGWGIGTSLYLDPSGTVRAAFAHRRLREYPVDGGAATLAESVHEPELTARAVALCRALQLTGFVMVEWRRDSDGGPTRLLEVNPRLWGSLALAIECGVNFPAIAYGALTGAPPAPPPSYAAGVRCRFLVPGDLLHYWRNPARHRLDPSWWRFRDSGPWWDEWAADDRGPAFGRLASLWPLLTEPEWRRYC